MARSTTTAPHGRDWEFAVLHAVLRRLRRGAHVLAAHAAEPAAQN
ncbi:hypothetical protein ACTXG6_09240 [Pseudonocardia sp. Cha107L01]